MVVTFCWSSLKEFRLEILMHLPQHFFVIYLPYYTWFVPAMGYGIVQTINSVGKVWSL